MIPMEPWRVARIERHDPDGTVTEWFTDDQELIREFLEAADEEDQ